MSSLVSYFLRRDLESCCPHINLLVHVNAGDDKEDPRAAGSSSHEATQPEDDGPLVLLHHLDSQQEGGGQGDQDQEDRQQCYQKRTNVRSFVTFWDKNFVMILNSYILIEKPWKESSFREI